MPVLPTQAFQTSASQPSLESQTSLLAPTSQPRSRRECRPRCSAALSVHTVYIAEYATVGRRSSNGAPRSSDIFWVIVYSEFGPPESLWLRPDATFENLKVFGLHPSTAGCACVRSPISRHHNLQASSGNLGVEIWPRASGQLLLPSARIQDDESRSATQRALGNLFLSPVWLLRACGKTHSVLQEQPVLPVLQARAQMWHKGTKPLQ